MTAARQTIREIVVPETKPATEWILGRPVQKVSPQRRHAVLQAALAERLRGWARGRGQVGTEWRFRITPPGEFTRPLVPDVAYLSFDRMKGLSEQDLDTPPHAPDIAVEILSPDDRSADVEHKRQVYLAAGVRLLLIVDPGTEGIVAYDSTGAHVRADRGTYTNDLFPGLEIPLLELFAELDLPT